MGSLCSDSADIEGANKHLIPKIEHGSPSAGLESLQGGGPYARGGLPPRVSRNASPLTPNDLSSLADGSESYLAPGVRKSESSELAGSSLQKPPFSPVTSNSSAGTAGLPETVEAELISTERAYLEHLRILYNDFLVPLFNKSILPKEKRFLASEIIMIFGFHKEFLLDLQKTDDVAELFLKRADFFKIYDKYVVKYPQILEMLSTQKDNPKFLKFTGGDSQQLSSLLIRPIQRIPRYELLLKELHRGVMKTLPNSPRRFKLEKAMEKVKSVAEHLNEQQKSIERMSRMFEISSKFTNLPPKIDVWKPDRKFIAEEELKRRSKYDSNKLQDGRAILFSDILFVTDYYYRYKTHVCLCDLLAVKTWENSARCGIKIKVVDAKGVDLICPTIESAKIWENRITKTKHKFETAKHSRIAVIKKRESMAESVRTRDSARRSTRGTVHGDRESFSISLIVDAPRVLSNTSTHSSQNELRNTNGRGGGSSDFYRFGYNNNSRRVEPPLVQPGAHAGAASNTHNSARIRGASRGLPPPPPGNRARGGIPLPPRIDRNTLRKITDEGQSYEDNSFEEFGGHLRQKHEPDSGEQKHVPASVSRSRNSSISYSIG